MKAVLASAQILGSILLMSAASMASVKTTEHMRGSLLRPVGEIHLANLPSKGPASPLSIEMIEPFQPGGNDGDDHDYDHGHDYDRDHGHDYDRDHGHDYDRDHGHDYDHDHDKAPIPTPEPVTAVLFGAAMLVGGGILRRRRRAGQN